MDGMTAATVSIVFGGIVVISGVIALLHSRLPLPPMAILPPENSLVSTMLRRYALVYFLALLAAIALFVTTEVANTRPTSWLETFVVVVRGLGMGVCLIFALLAAIALTDDLRRARLSPPDEWAILSEDNQRRLARFQRVRLIATRITGIVLFVLAGVTLAGPLTIQLGAAWGLGLSIPFVPMCIGDVETRRLWYFATLESESDESEQVDEE